MYPLNPRSIKTLACAIASAAASLAAHAVAVPGQGTWETTLQARDFNHDQIADAYYDTALNISWLANWNVKGAHDVWDGLMNWHDARDWAKNLKVDGVKNWRLPTTDPDKSSSGTNPPPDSSEMAHMFYVTLGNIGYPNQGWGLDNTANFVNMQVSHYWSETGSSVGLAAWQFHFGEGYQGTLGKSTPLFAVAVHNGDVGVVPEPQTVWLMLTGLAGLFGLRRSRRVR